MGRNRQRLIQVRDNMTIRNDIGEFRLVHKANLDIDHSYQRTAPKGLARQIAEGEWDWAKFGTLSVAQRPSGTLCVFDGQNRVLAARLRDDIHMLPAMVYQMADIDREAEAFVGSNTKRKPVTPYDTFKAQLVAQDATALAVNAMIRSTGYEVTSAAHKDFTLNCITSIIREYIRNPVIAERVWPLVSDIHSGQVISSFIWTGCTYLETVMEKAGVGSLTESHNVKTLCGLGKDGLNFAIVRTKLCLGSATPKVCATAILDAINRGRRTRRIEVAL